MTENLRPTNLRTQAREALRGKWGEAALVALVMYAISGIFLGVSCGWNFASLLHPNVAAGGSMWRGNASNLLNLLVGAPLGIGVYFLFLDVARGAKVEFETLFEAFKSYGRYIVGILVVWIFIVLWTLLLIVPGIIKAYAYSMTYYIMRENPEMSGNEARKESMRMMRGHKAELFCLHLSFLGWALLCILTLGVGFLWLAPYIYTSTGRFWEALKAGE